MTDGLYYTALHDPVSDGFSELDDVVLLHGLSVDDRILPEGSEGTVVSVHHRGKAYTVEFEDPFHALIVVEAADVRGVPEATREQLAAAAR